MRVAVAGGTGFIGRHLTKALSARGDEVIILSRSAGAKGGDASGWLTWNQLEADPHLLEGIDGVVNLAGETINQRWTEPAKRSILDSRIEAAGRLAAAIEKLERKPAVVVNGSSMAAYGTSETETYDESSPAKAVDFLSDVVREWEAAADGIRVQRLVKLRVGLVLGADGGALPKMLLPYKLMAGGRLGSGNQWVSWIHIDDLIGLILLALDGAVSSGPLNGTAPHPVTNDEFGRTAARVLRRPHYLPLPSAAFRLLLGDMADLLLKGQRVLPSRALAAGYRFRFPELKPALRSLLRPDT
ncbi:epimerase [Paenibacillus sp. J31TS4]|uniref:TIGR01777 family oxidoreductase n=1 Tax=Paenibacillus sp. J31TS4 TaxID=2807195 RepID=UPI001B1FD20D|nr:TIGR01777 family oxidoreductase [Paenibacillus sp. J31TS4]GIP37273.1 epimerase [Paenibacillus sp. J31TS4]